MGTGSNPVLVKVTPRLLSNRYPDRRGTQSLSTRACRGAVFAFSGESVNLVQGKHTLKFYNAVVCGKDPASATLATAR